MESLEQIATFDIEKLLSKSATLSENLLLQLWLSLTKEWGTGSVGILPKDFIQKLKVGWGHSVAGNSILGGTGH